MNIFLPIALIVALFLVALVFVFNQGVKYGARIMKRRQDRLDVLVHRATQDLSSDEAYDQMVKAGLLHKKLTH